MRYIPALAFFLVCLLFSPGLSAQEEGQMAGDKKKKPEMKTLFNQPAANGAYGGLSFGVTSINDHTSFIGGFKGGWIINHGFVLGMGGYGFYNNMTYVNAGNYRLTGGYGGLLLESIIAANSPVHASLSMLIGGGGITRFRTDAYFWDPFYDLPFAGYFIFVPGVELELNLVKFFRLAFGVDYRLTSDIYLKDASGNLIVPTHALRGFAGHLVLKFGAF